MSGKHAEIILKSGGKAGGNLTFSPSEMILRNQHGNIVPLRRQSCQILAVLAEDLGKVVSKDDLIDRVWGKIAVTDDSLNQCISDIRKALGDTERTILQTYPRKGYTLKALSENAYTHKASDSFRLRTVIFAALCALVAVLGVWIWGNDAPTPRLPAVAVLAFDDLSPGPDQGYLSDAISEGIITELARFRPFNTIARNSSFSFRDSPHDIREIAAALGADYILEGSQQKQGDYLRVMVKLIDAKSGTHIWSNSYSGALDKMFEFQTEIIRGVASSVGGKLAVYPNLTGDRSTITAMHLSAKGLVHLRTSGLAAKEKARPFFEAAIEADPDSSIGYLGMGFYFRNVALYDVNESTRKFAARNAMSMANKAFEIDPDNYLTHYLLGHLHMLAGDIRLAQSRYDKAKALNPSFSNVFVGGSSTKIYSGDVEGAIADIQYAMQIDPLHPEWFHGQLAWAYWAQGNCKAADASYRNMVKVPPVTQKSWAAVLACLGNQAAARTAMQIYLSARPSATLKKEQDRFGGYWQSREQLNRWLDDLRVAGMPE